MARECWDDTDSLEELILHLDSPASVALHSEHAAECTLEGGGRRLKTKEEDSFCRVRDTRPTDSPHISTLLPPIKVNEARAGFKVTSIAVSGSGNSRKKAPPLSSD